MNTNTSPAPIPVGLLRAIDRLVEDDIPRTSAREEYEAALSAALREAYDAGFDDGRYGM